MIRVSFQKKFDIQLLLNSRVPNKAVFSPSQQKIPTTFLFFHLTNFEKVAATKSNFTAVVDDPGKIPKKV